jgi:hypothetical protein
MEIQVWNISGGSLPRWCTLLDWPGRHACSASPRDQNHGDSSECQPFEKPEDVDKGKGLRLFDDQPLKYLLGPELSRIWG